MRHSIRLALVLPTLFLAHFAVGQAALLVLIFGDKVASENFYFSIDAGINLATLPGVSGTSPVVGPYFGLGTYIKLNDKWAFTPEFKPISPRGANGFERLFVDNTGAVRSSASQLELSYIDVPMQFHRKISERFYVRAGPQVSFLTGGDVATTGELVGGPDFTVTENIRGQLEPIDIALPIDLGIVFAKPRGYKGVDIRVRYCHGFSDVFKENGSGLSSNNRTFQFFLSLPFVNMEPGPGS